MRGWGSGRLEVMGEIGLIGVIGGMGVIGRERDGRDGVEGGATRGGGVRMGGVENCCPACRNGENCIILGFIEHYA